MKVKFEKKIDKLGRLVMPIEIRNALGFKENELLRLDVADDKVIIRKNVATCQICGAEEGLHPKLGICRCCISSIKNAV